MMRTRVGAIALLVCLGHAAGGADVTLRNGHPRLLLTPEAVARLADQTKPGGPLEKDWSIVVKHVTKRAAERSDSIRTLPTAALVYRVMKKRGQDEEAEKIFAYIKYVADKSKVSRWKPGYDQDEAIKIGLALDWVYDRLSKEDLARYAKKYGKPGDPPGGATWSSSPHMTHAARFIRATLFDGTGIDDTAYRKDVETYIDYFRHDTAPAFDLCGGAYPSGFHYGREREFAVLWILEMLRTATGTDLLTSNTFAQEQGAWYLYNRLAGGEYTLPFFQDCAIDHGTPNPFASYLLARSLGDRSMQWWAVRSRGKTLELDPGHWTHMQDWPQLLWFDPALAPIKLTELPKAHLFGAGGMDVAVMRSGWGEADTYVAVHGGDFYYGHQHAMAGHIEIFRRGPLAVDSGAYSMYQAVDKSGGAQNKCGIYYRYSIAHNVLLVYKPGVLGLHTEMARNGFNDGGQIRYGSPDNMAVLRRRNAAGGSSNRSDVIAFASEAAYDYVALDAARAYNNGEKDSRLKSYVREVVFVRPNIIFVCDRVNALSGEWSKHVQFHVMDKPQVDGTETQLAGKGPAAGIWLYEGATRAEVTGGERLDGKPNGGRMTIFPVQPKCRIGVVGGPRERMIIPEGPYKGKPYFGGTAASFEYWSKPVGIEGGENCWFKLGRPSQYPSCAQSGWGRVEIIPAGKSAEDVFITAIVVGDRNDKAEAKVVCVGKNGAQVRFGDVEATVIFDPAARAGGTLSVTRGGRKVSESRLATEIRNSTLPLLRR